MLPSTPPLPDASSNTWLEAFTAALLRSPGVYVIFSLLIVLADFLTGPFIQFPIIFVVPVALCAWFCSPRLAVVLALALPIVRFVFTWTWNGVPDFYFNLGYQAINMIIRMTVMGLLAYFVGRTAQQNRELAKRVRLLQGTLPICFECKKVQDEKNEWQEVELYIERHSDARFNHSLCPACATKSYGDILGKA